MLNDDQIKEVMRRYGICAGSSSEWSVHEVGAGRKSLEAYLRTIGEPENTFPLNPNGASKWAHLQKHDGAEAIGVVFRTGSGSVGSLVDGRVVWADWLAHPTGSKPESVNAELLEALKECVDLSWIDDSHVVDFDKSVMFGPHYDFSGVDGPCRAEFIGEHECIVWPRGGKWSAYCTYDGSLWFEKFTTSHEAKERCMRLLDKVIPDHPAMKARAAIARAESAIESSPKPVTLPAMKAAFRTTRVEAGEFIMAFKFRDIEDMDRADDEWRAAMVIETPAKVSPCAGHAVQQEAELRQIVGIKEAIAGIHEFFDSECHSGITGIVDTSKVCGDRVEDECRPTFDHCYVNQGGGGITGYDFHGTVYFHIGNGEYATVDY